MLMTPWNWLEAPGLSSIAFSTCLDLKNKTSLRTFLDSSAPYPSQLQEADGREVGRSQGEACREAEIQREKEPPTKIQIRVRHGSSDNQDPEAMRGTLRLAREIWRSFQLEATRSPQEAYCA